MTITCIAAVGEFKMNGTKPIRDESDGGSPEVGGQLRPTEKFEFCKAKHEHERELQSPRETKHAPIRLGFAIQYDSLRPDKAKAGPASGLKLNQRSARETLPETRHADKSSLSARSASDLRWTQLIGRDTQRPTSRSKFELEPSAPQPCFGPWQMPPSPRCFALSSA